MTLRLPRAPSDYSQADQDNTRQTLEREDRRNFKNGDRFSRPTLLFYGVVADLPDASAYLNGIAIVTDADTSTGMSAVQGGGTDTAPIYSDGDEWRLFGRFKSGDSYGDVDFMSGVEECIWGCGEIPLERGSDWMEDIW